MLVAMVVINTLLSHLALAESQSDIRVANGGATERYERAVDEVAILSQKNAVSKLSALINKYRGTDREASLLVKLAEFQQQTAAIEFRIAHGLAHNSKQSIDLSNYKVAMTDSIKTLSRVLSYFAIGTNIADEVAPALVMRGRAYEEIGDKAAATRDYLELIKRMPDSPETVRAYMALAEFAIDANKHVDAIKYLSEIEKRPESPHYPFALYKLAWSHFNLKQIELALSYTERHVRYYENHEMRGSSHADSALRENMLLDSTVFYFEGYEQKLPQFTISEAMPFFRKLDSGVILGKMALRFARLLRSHGHAADLTAWKDELLVSESSRPETLDVLITTYEYQLNGRKFANLIDLSRDILSLHHKNPKFEAFVKVERLLLDTADLLQKVIAKNKGVDGLTKLSSTLAAIYDVFTRIVDESDQRIPQVHYNLAETLFGIYDFEGATLHYRWIVEHGGKWQKDAALKAIASRYEVLRQRQLIPTEIVPKARLVGASTNIKLDLLLSEWLGWLEGQDSRGDNQQIDNFNFEANRALYAQGDINVAAEKMRLFALKHPRSSYAIPSASLAIDTYLASLDWDGALSIVNGFLKVKAWSGAFLSKLNEIAADVSYKQIESMYKAGQHQAALREIDKFESTYKSSPRIYDCLSLGGKVALLLNDKERAEKYFSKLIAGAGESLSTKSPIGTINGSGESSVAAALVARASLREGRYEFSLAARDYVSLLNTKNAKLDEKNIDLMQKKVLTFAWLSDDPSELAEVVANKIICNSSREGNSAEACERYRALLYLRDQPRAGAEIHKLAFDLARKGAAENRALWAAVALFGAKSLGFRDRLLMLRQFAVHFELVDPLVQFSLVQWMSQSLPQVLRINRMAIRDVAPLRPDERYITRRVEVIHEMENAVTKLMKLSWARPRALILNELAILYLEFARELSGMQASKNLVIPFEEKGHELRSKAFDIASTFAIEDESFMEISEPFFRDNPSLAKTFVRPEGGGAPGGRPVPLDVMLLDRLGVREKSPIMSHWLAALSAKNWVKMAFLLQEANQKLLMQKLSVQEASVQAGILGVMKSISLYSVGAQAEALLELGDKRKDLPFAANSEAALILLGHYAASLSKDKTIALKKDMEKLRSDAAFAKSQSHSAF